MTVVFGVSSRNVKQVSIEEPYTLPALQPGILGFIVNCFIRVFYKDEMDS